MTTPSPHNRVKSDEQSAMSYGNRKPRKHLSEMRLVSDAFGMIPVDTISSVLDAPCGVGRISLWLSQKGFDVTGIDLGEAAVRASQEVLTKAELPAHIHIQDIFNTSFDDNSFDATVCFRFLHHFRGFEDQDRLVAELCRVTGKYVVISYFSPYSVTTIRRRIDHYLGRKPITQFPTSVFKLNRMFEQAGFRILGKVKRSGFLHSLQVAVFYKDS